MEDKISKLEIKTLYLRWIYMVIAIIASATLFLKPVLSFRGDEGIIYVRSFEMTQTVFQVIQTEIDTGATSIGESMSVKGLWYCNWVMLLGSILCFLCFFSRNWRNRLVAITIWAGGTYYILMVYYAVRISESFMATLYPNFMAIIPAVVIEMMILVIRNMKQEALLENEEEQEE